MSVLAVIPWMGCGGKTPLHGPAVPPPPVEKNDMQSHLEGVWENPKRGGSPRQMIFDPGGRLTFRGGLEFYNPAQWELDSIRKELRISLPAADADKLQVFQMYVHDGIKAFDPVRKK